MDVDARYVDIDGATAFVERRGDGPAVLCLHTAGQSGRQWRDVLAQLPGHGWSVHVPDLPGHGRSDLLPEGPVDTIERYAAWCGELLDALDLERVLVVGCSIGGKVALQLALDQGARIAGVVAMAADGWNTALTERALLRSVEDAGSPSRGDRTFLGTVAACGSSIDPDRVRVIARRHQCEDPEVSIVDLIAWTRHDLRERAAAIGCPVHLAYGTDDFWVRGADIRALGASIPNCRVDELVGVGHYPMEELPDFALKLHGWLEQLRDDPN